MAEAGWSLTLALVGIGGFAGLGGAIFGLGGGFFLIPALTVLFGVPIRTAVAAGLVAVVATSTASAAGYLRIGRVDVPMAFRLEAAAAAGAVLGALGTPWLPERVIYLAFAAAVLFVAALMLRRRVGRVDERAPAGAGSAAPPPTQDESESGGEAARAAGGRAPVPRRRHPAAALSALGLAGVASAVLGLGGGFAKVPTMHLLLGVPMHVAVATSTLMIGMTASTGAWIYWARGDLLLPLAAPLALGVLGGGTLGARLGDRIPARVLRPAFAVILLVIAAQMAWRGLQGAFH